MEEEDGVVVADVEEVEVVVVGVVVLVVVVDIVFPPNMMLARAQISPSAITLRMNN